MRGFRVKDIEFIIKNYVYIELPNQEMVVQCRDGIIKTQEERLQKLFVEFDEKNSRLITKSELRKRFFDETDEVIHFLKTNGIIERKRKWNFSINKVKVFSDQKEIQELLMSAIVEDNDALEIVEGSYTAEKNTIVIVFLNAYRKSLAKSIRDEFKDRDDSYLLMSYTYNGNFYIDSLYLGSYKIPCHLCHISNIEMNIRNSSNNSITYQRILDTIYSEFDDFPVTVPLDKSQTLNISTMIINKFNKLITLQDGIVVYPEEFINATMMSLKSKEIIFDTPTHWELCDCYE